MNKIEKELLKAFSDVNVLSKEMIILLGGSEYIISKFKDEGLIEYVIIYNNQSGFIEKVLRMTNKGRLLAEQLGLFFAYYSQSAEHDFMLSTFYLGLSKELRDSWLSERNLHNYFQDYLDTLETTNFYKYKELAQAYKYDKISTLDGAFVNNKQEIVGVEAISKYYSVKSINSKRRFANELGIKLIEVKGGKSYEVTSSRNH